MTSILTIVPPVPGMLAGTGVSPVVISARSPPAGPRVTGPRPKSPRSWPPIAEIMDGVTAGDAPVGLAEANAPCKPLTVELTVMVRDSDGLAAIVWRTACVLLASASRAPAVAANTAKNVSSASAR